MQLLGISRINCGRVRILRISDGNHYERKINNKNENRIKDINIIAQIIWVTKDLHICTIGIGWCNGYGRLYCIIVTSRMSYCYDNCNKIERANKIIVVYYLL